MANKGLSRKALATTAIAAALAATIITASALDDSADGSAANNDTLSTSAINTDNILDQAGIQLSSDDEVIRTDNNGAVSMTILKAFPVEIDYNGQTTSVTVTKGTVADVLNEAGITLKEGEKVTPSLETEVDKDTVIKIDNSVEVQITLLGVQDTYNVPAGTVREALESIGVEVDKYDKINFDQDEEIYDGIEIVYTDVEIEKVTNTKVVDFKTKTIYDDTLAQGKTKIKTYGSEGEKEVVLKQTYEDGELVDTEEVSSEITKKPVTQVEVVGTKKSTPKTTKPSTSASGSNSSSSSGGNTFVDNNGNTVSYSQLLTGSGTAYTAPAGSGTATGVTVSVGCVAVNPNIIPYGSKLYITSTDGSYVYGYATAVDTGGALMDGSALVDLFMDTYDDCAKFGRKNVNVYVLN